MQLPVPEGRTITGVFYKNVVLKKLAHFKRRRPKTGLKYLPLVHDNTPAHKARIVTEFLESEFCLKVNPPFSPDLALGYYFLFPELEFHPSGKRYKSRNSLGSAVYWFLIGVPFQDIDCAFKIGLTA